MPNAIKVDDLIVAVPEDKEVQFVDELEDLCKKYAGEDYSFNFNAMEV